jgi:fatty acid desaturase
MDDRTDRRGEEFRDDLRPAPGVGSGNAAARRILSADELAPLTRLNDGRSAFAVGISLGVIAAALGFGIVHWGSAWVLLSMLVVGVQQHALFILAHESAHYRLFAHRGLNDAIGRGIGMVSGISMSTYRVVHRLHHNNLYTEEDPDTAIHGGYPRGVGYLARKLGQDFIGWNAWKTYAYFFGAPALNDATGRAARPLDDTSPQLRAAARADRRAVIVAQIALPLAALAFGGWRGLAMYAVLWLAPMLTVLQPILRLRAICEHGAVTDLSSPLTAARTNRTWGSPLNWLGRALVFPHHVNHHLEHHLYPAVPHYHLPRLHRLLLAKGALDGAEVRDLADTLGRIFAERAKPLTRATAP